MTEPARIPPVTLAVALPRWCQSCQIHMATTTHPTCPVCDDDAKKEQR